MYIKKYQCRVDYIIKPINYTEHGQPIGICIWVVSATNHLHEGVDLCESFLIWFSCI